MKILHFYKTYQPESFGGIPQVIFQLAEGCSKQGVESDVLYLSKRGAARNEPLGQHMTHRSKLDIEIASTGFSLSVIRDFAELAKQADIIHYHFPWPFMDIVHFLSCTKKPTVISYHSDIVKQKHLLKLYQPLMHKFLSTADAIVAASPNYVSSSEVLQQHKDRVQVIPYGLAQETYLAPTTERLAYWRERCGEKFFLFVGALRYYKGLSWLLKAAAISKLPLIIAGDGGIEVQLKEEADALGIKHVQFVGCIDDEDKAALLTLCYSLVFPSHLRSEAFGISLLEGAMYGKPLISCEISTGTTYVNLADKTGLVVPPEDSSALSIAMVKLWNDEDMASEMGANARLRYKELFSSEQMVSAYIDLYHSLL